MNTIEDMTALQYWKVRAMAFSYGYDTKNYERIPIVLICIKLYNGLHLYR